MPWPLCIVGANTFLPPFINPMATALHLSQTFAKENWSHQVVPTGDFEPCSFTQCNISHCDLSRGKFAECTFTGCDLSMIKLTEAALRDVTFKECKLLGVDFSRCKEMLFGVAFDHCILDHAVFHKRKMNGTRFLRCSLKGVDFEEAYLEKAVFDQCDLDQAFFVNSQLQKADFRTARYIALDPDRNKVEGARFSVEGALGLLGKYGLENG